MSVQLSVPGCLHLLLIASIVMENVMGSEEFHLPLPEREQNHGTGHGNFGTPNKREKGHDIGIEDGENQIHGDNEDGDELEFERGFEEMVNTRLDGKKGGPKDGPNYKTVILASITGVVILVLVIIGERHQSYWLITQACQWNIAKIRLININI